MSENNSKEAVSRKPKDKMKKAPEQKARLKRKKMVQGFVKDAKKKVTGKRGHLEIKPEKMRKYQRGHDHRGGIHHRYDRAKFELKTHKFDLATEQAARTEKLLQEQAGFLTAAEGEDTADITQHEIANAVDISSSQKFFELKLNQFGPYRMDYTRNGRFLLLGGGRGHVAAFDWQTKTLMCEINVMESLNDINWLHQETMFAVAQKKWVHIYDNQGVELHCVDRLHNVLRMEFLPYHFLLATANAMSRLSYLDVSIGKMVTEINVSHGRLDVMCQNPTNAIIHLGHSGGTVTLWSPNQGKPLVKLLCHGAGTRSISVDPSGKYMATGGIDRTLKVWDLRTFKALYSYKVASGPGSLAFSQRGLLAAGIGNIVEVYQGATQQKISSPYMTHEFPATVANMQFCPFEDVLGVGHGEGFSSLLIPGAGEPNFDALEANPYQTKKQRQQAEVKMLLEKIQPDMITLDTGDLGKVDVKSLQQQMAEREEIIWLKPKKIEFQPRNKTKGRNKTGNLLKRKEMVRSQHLRDEVEKIKKKKAKLNKDIVSGETKEPEPYSVFDRFRKKKE